MSVNQFATDTDRELNMVVEKAKKYGAYDAVIANHWAKGGEGALDLAKALLKATEKPANFK